MTHSNSVFVQNGTGLGIFLSDSLHEAAKDASTPKADIFSAAFSPQSESLFLSLISSNLAVGLTSQFQIMHKAPLTVQMKVDPPPPRALQPSKEVFAHLNAISGIL